MNYQRSINEAAVYMDVGQTRKAIRLLLDLSDTISQTANPNYAIAMDFGAALEKIQAEREEQAKAFQKRQESKRSEEIIAGFVERQQAEETVVEFDDPKAMADLAIALNKPTAKELLADLKYKFENPAVDTRTLRQAVVPYSDLMPLLEKMVDELSFLQEMNCELQERLAKIEYPEFFNQQKEE